MHQFNQRDPRPQFTLDFLECFPDEGLKREGLNFQKGSDELCAILYHAH